MQIAEIEGNEGLLVAPAIGTTVLRGRGLLSWTSITSKSANRVNMSL